MKIELLTYLRCPLCKGELTCLKPRDMQQAITNGILECAGCKEQYPVLSGIPVMIPRDKLGPYVHRLKDFDFLEKLDFFKGCVTRRTFDEFIKVQASNRWTFQRAGDPYAQEDHASARCDVFTARFFFEETQLTQEEIQNKVILDACCGGGRGLVHTVKIARIVFGIDISETIYQIQDMLSEALSRNLFLVRCDLTSLPFSDNFFDIVYSQRALHHIFPMQKGIKEAVRVLRAGGRFSFSVYSHENNVIMRKFVEPARHFVSSVWGLRMMFLLSLLIALFVFPFVKIYRLICFRIDSPFVFHRLFLHWGSHSFRRFRFHVVFDLLHAPHAEYVSKEKIKSLLGTVGVNPQRFFLQHGTVWCASGIKTAQEMRQLQMKKILLYNPPCGLWLRGEARCEQNLDTATAYTVTAPMTLCYLAAIFRNQGIQPKIIDCPVEKITYQCLQRIINEFAPDIAILNACAFNLKEDMATIDRLYETCPEVLHFAIVPYFNSVPIEQISCEMFRNVTGILVGEAEAVAYDLAEWANGARILENIRGMIIHQRGSHQLIKTEPMPHVAELDALPMPARDLIRNQLYLRPDNGRPMASIIDGRGCPSNCIYCLAPITTGNRVRKRSVASVVREISDCVHTYAIRDFLFRSDCFTINKTWVMEFCRLLRTQPFHISWAANSKTISFDEEMASAMREAGCFLVEFGIESGSDESLRLQKKGTTIVDAKRAVAAAKKAGILTYGTFLIGFPWEALGDLRDTEFLIHRLDLDFIEVQIVAPFQGTELFSMMSSQGLIDFDTVGYDTVRNPVIKGTKYLSRETLIAFRKQVLRRFYLRPSYILRTLFRIGSAAELGQYMKYGIRLLTNLRT